MWGNTTAGGGSIGAQDINDRLNGEYRAAVAEFETRQQAWQARRDAGEEAGERPAAPALRDFVKSDTTIEALIGVLQDNPAGLLIGRDELAGGIHGFVKYAKTGATDLRHWLQLSNAGTVDYLCKTGGYGSAGWACPSPAPPSRA